MQKRGLSKGIVIGMVIVVIILAIIAFFMLRGDDVDTDVESGSEEAGKVNDKAPLVPLVDCGDLACFADALENCESGYGVSYSTVAQFNSDVSYEIIGLTKEGCKLNYKVVQYGRVRSDWTRDPNVEPATTEGTCIVANYTHTAEQFRLSPIMLRNENSSWSCPYDMAESYYRQLKCSTSMEAYRDIGGVTVWLPMDTKQIDDFEIKFRDKDKTEFTSAIGQGDFSGTAILIKEEENTLREKVITISGITNDAQDDNSKGIIEITYELEGETKTADITCEPFFA